MAGKQTLVKEQTKTMTRKLDEIVIVDIESTCWEGKNPDGMSNDIIEIGICLLNVKTGEITKNEGILVKPERSKISPFCTELTTITQQLIDANGIPFKEALKKLKDDYLTNSRTWASYGAYDLNHFKKQCSEMNVGYPFGPSHINVKTLYALKAKLNREIGMAEALDGLNIKLEGTHHRGVDDAKNIAKIMNWVLNN